MSKSPDINGSLASPAAMSTSSASSPCLSYVSSISPGSISSNTSMSPQSASTSTKSSQRSRTKCDKSLGLKSTSSIDRRKRLAANARERKRMHLLNKAYDQLRQRLVDAENKSKYDVLVQAKEYIQALATICEKFDRENPHHLQNQMQPQQQLASQMQQPQITSLLNANPPIETHSLYHLDVSFETQNSPVDMRNYNHSAPTSSHSDNQYSRAYLVPRGTLRQQST